MKIKKTIKHCCTWLFQVCYKPALLLLGLLILNSPIEVKALKPLWLLANIQEGWGLTIFVGSISLLLAYYGWALYRIRVDRKHISYYLFAVGLYALYYGSWDYVDTYYRVDCFLSILLAFPLGFILHWGCFGFVKLYKRWSGNADEKVYQWSVPSMTLLDDKPVKKAAEDEFRFDGFAQRIVRSIVESQREDSYSLGLTGIWGAGKTSMLNLIKNYLKEVDSVIVIEFNPRESADVKCIQRDFLTVVSNKLKEYHSGAQHVLTDYMKDLRVLADDTIWAKVLDVTRLSDTESTKENVELIIEQIGKRILVLIDDFDRLTGEEILEVLKVIDKNGSFKNTFYISAYDKEYVNGVLRNYLLDTSGRDFTDKYFNLELRLPDRKQFHKNGYIQRRLYALVDDGTIKNVNHKQIDEALMSVVGVMDSYLPTARDIKRYIGLAMASYIDVQEDVEIRDFLLASLIKYKYPNEYNALYRQNYFARHPFESSSATNFTLKDQKELSNVKSYDVLRLLFPTSANQEINDSHFGYRHLSWKRSFDYYFFDQELGHIPFKQLICLTNPDIRLDEFKSITKDWTNDNLRRDVAEFVISRDDMVHSVADFKNYLRLIVMARYYCPSHQLYLACGRLLVKANLEDYTKRFNVSEKVYCDVIDKFISNGGHWALQAILIQDALHLCLNPGEEVDLIFDAKYFQKVAEDRLRHVLKTYNAGHAATEDVYEILKANVAEVVEGENVISKSASEKVRTDMIEHASKYYKDIIWHKPIPGKKTGLIVGFHQSLPLKELFGNKDLFCLYLQEVDKSDPSIVAATECLLDIYELVEHSNFKPVQIKTRESNQNIRQCDFKTFNLIFEGER